MPTLLMAPPAATLAPKVGGAALVAQPLAAAILAYANPAPTSTVAVVGSALVGTATVG